MFQGWRRCFASNVEGFDYLRFHYIQFVCYLYKMDTQKLGIALATGAITIGLANRYIVHNKYGIHHAALSVGLGLIVGVVTYHLIPVHKQKTNGDFDFIMPKYDYDKTKFQAKVVTSLPLQDGEYPAGWTGYSIYINDGSSIIEGKTDDGIRSPFPVPFTVQVKDGSGFVLHSNGEKEVDQFIWNYYKKKYPASTY